MGEERVQAAYHREELAWAAGFWDGEGSCGYYLKNDGRTRKASNSYLRASVNQNHVEPLERFLAAVKVGKIYGPYQRTDANPYWSYQVAGKAVEILMDSLFPWLCEPKRQQYLAAKERFAERPAQGLRKGRNCPPDCTCGRHDRYSTEGLTESQLRRRVKMREYTRRYREKMKSGKR